MKLATFAVDTPVGRRRRVGVVVDHGDEPGGDVLADATAAYAAALAAEGEADPLAVARAHAPPDMRSLLERGERGMAAADIARAHAASTDADRGPGGARLRYRREEVDLLAPVPRPASLRDFMAFEEHVRNSLGEEPPDVWYEVPVFYKGNADTVVGPGAEVEWPAYSDQVDYELELAAVVGKRGTGVPAADAAEYIAGYTILDDFSARDTQLREMQARLGPAKGKDFASALGPYLVTPDEVDLAGAEMTAEVNGEVWSSGTPGEMYHSFADIVAHVSRAEPLVPGAVLGSGTVGEGCGLELGRFPERGDTIALTVEGIGRLENRVV